jgi:hypothetical protein
MKIQKTFFVLMLGLLLSSCGKDNDKDANKNAAITDFASIVQTADRRELVGKTVDLSNVPVDTVVGTYVFWAGEGHSGIPVFRKDRIDNEKVEHVKPKDMVRMNGVIRLAENVEAADPLWKSINESEKQDILNAKVFISADRVQIIH